MKKLDLSGISSASTSTRASHPVVQIDNPEAEALLTQFVLINPQYKTLKNQSETISKQLAGHIKRIFFNRFKGVTAESSTLLVRVGTTTVKLTTKNAYSTKCDDDSMIRAAIGDELTDKYFRQATVLKLDLTKVPENVEEAFASRVIALAQELGVTDAVTASQCIQPRAGFHEARTTVLSPEQNLALDDELPITAYPQL
jgi:hypothetical protein